MAIAMTAKEIRKNAEDCLKLAQETNEIFAKTALIETGSGGGLGAVSCWDSGQGYRSKGLGRQWRQREDCAIIIQRHRKSQRTNSKGGVL